MLDFNEFLMRHGETGVQFIIEQIERLEGITARKQDTLEQRWTLVMEVNAIPAARNVAA